ncbi:MAG: hypothetical protein Kow006_12760 [Gammaproteobacteria bacterium]
MVGAANQIPNEIGCLNTATLRTALISTAGFHCDAWQANRVVVRNDRRQTLNYVIKCHKRPCSPREVALYQRDYLELRRRLGRIIPEAVFIRTKIDGFDNVIAIAKAITPWFNIANPLFEEETVPLLRRLTRARSQLTRFVKVAREWCEADQVRVIDLWGVDNLVLDNRQNIRYVDSFNVFFYPDLFYAVEDAGEFLAERIAVSLRRLEYLEYLVKETG